MTGPDGKRERVTGARREWRSEEDARAAMERERALRRRGVSPGQVTVGPFLVEWLASKGDIRASTRRAYEQHIRKWLVPLLGLLRLADLRPEDVAAALAEVDSSAANRQRVRATLRSALNDAVRAGLIERNPAALVRLPSGKRPRALVWTPDRVRAWQTTGAQPSPVMVWTAEQLGEFLDAAADDRLYPLFHLVAYRGLRRGESLGLRWEDVDLVARHAGSTR